MTGDVAAAPRAGGDGRQTRTVWDEVVDQAARTPGAVAAQSDHLLTYAQLVDRVTDLATAVATHVAPGGLVALEVADGVGGAVALLAAMKAGCAAMPLNRDSPAAHRDAVLAEARPAVVISDRDGRRLGVRPPESGAERAPRTSGMADVAYVMYTSGSTGRPKGVAVPHRALLDRLAGLAAVPGLAAGESIVSMTALSFDISLAEILLPLTVGARFISAPAMARVDPEMFIRFLADHDPDVIQATPSFWRLALAAAWRGAPGSRLWSGGEALSTPLAAQLLPRGAQLWNLYGPTEATIWATAARVDDPDVISLGDPLPGTRLCVAHPGDDGPGALVDTPGQEGELLLYGAGLASGYLDRPELTTRAFQVRPTPDGDRLVYRTGDRVRRRPDGSLEFLGRTDGQIKLRGHRIELGEVESALERHPAVSQAAAVLADPGEASAHVVAFLVTTDDVPERELRRWLRAQLPLSHHPGVIRVLDEMPRTTAGKVDRVRLAAVNAR